MFADACCHFTLGEDADCNGCEDSQDRRGVVFLDEVGVIEFGNP